MSTLHVYSEHGYSIKPVQNFQARFLHEVRLFTKWDLPLLTPLDCIDEPNSSTASTSKRKKTFKATNERNPAKVVCNRLDAVFKDVFDFPRVPIEDFDIYDSKETANIYDIVAHEEVVGLKDIADELFTENSVPVQDETNLTDYDETDEYMPPFEDHLPKSMPDLTSLTALAIEAPPPPRLRTTVELVQSDDDETEEPSKESLSTMLSKSTRTTRAVLNRPTNYEACVDFKSLRTLQMGSFRGLKGNVDKSRVTSTLGLQITGRSALPLALSWKEDSRQTVSVKPKVPRSTKKARRKGPEKYSRKPLPSLPIQDSASSSGSISSRSARSIMKATHPSSDLLSIDFQISETVRVYRNEMKPSIDKVNHLQKIESDYEKSLQQTQELRKMLKQAKKPPSSRAPRTSKAKQRQVANPSGASSTKSGYCASLSSVATTVSRSRTALAVSSSVNVSSQESLRSNVPLALMSPMPETPPPSDTSMVSVLNGLGNHPSEMERNFIRQNLAAYVKFMESERNSANQKQSTSGSECSNPRIITSDSLSCLTKFRRSLEETKRPSKKRRAPYTRVYPSFYEDKERSSAGSSCGSVDFNDIRSPATPNTTRRALDKVRGWDIYDRQCPTPPTPLMPMNDIETPPGSPCNEHSNIPLAIGSGCEQSILNSSDGLDPELEAFLQELGQRGS